MAGKDLTQGEAEYLTMKGTLERPHSKILSFTTPQFLAFGDETINTTYTNIQKCQFNALPMIDIPVISISHIKKWEALFSEEGKTGLDAISIQKEYLLENKRHFAIDINIESKDYSGAFEKGAKLIFSPDAIAKPGDKVLCNISGVCQIREYERITGDKYRLNSLVKSGGYDEFDDKERSNIEAVMIGQSIFIPE